MDPKSKSESNLLGAPLFETLNRHKRELKRELPMAGGSQKWGEEEWPAERIIKYYGPATWANDGSWGYRTPIYLLNRLIRLQAGFEIVSNHTSDALELLAKQHSQMRAFVYQNRLALDYLLAKEGGVCAKFNESECCIEIDDYGEAIRGLAAEIKKVKLSQMASLARMIGVTDGACGVNGRQFYTSVLISLSGDGWYPDGVPPASSRNFYYITILRDPVSRYLSEWRHVQRGATWKASLHICDGRSPTTAELPSCYTGDDWSGCSLQEFMDCPYNLANNRQVRMLSDLSLVGCYNLSVMPEEQRNKVLLDSAKENLKQMAFFGLTEFQRKTQYLFEKTFNMNFISPFMQYNSTKASSVEIDKQTQQHIEALNFLDMELYDYAKDLFLQRYQYMRQKEHQEAQRKCQEQRKILRAKQTHLREQRRTAPVLTTQGMWSGGGDSEGPLAGAEKKQSPTQPANQR
ncbi:hypothetical protein HGM15179_018225 [Zosterops borbonicus]|uniref:Heparan-sulfate 6-O-sulfotransferase n=1 Tax=Zosterops borbonicus TaxID=364589 RepID=A0A8K1LCH5_9PASS|nr:hypothetical protein HGM15179_018225 [Zosterops borbonicus]